jgi:hypothetical protein
MLPMDIAHSPDSFEGKLSVQMVALMFVKTYLDNVLCIIRASLYNHLEKLREVLTKL